MTASSKGLTLSSLDGERPEDTVSVTLTWKQVALGIADLIDEEKYFTAEEREEYKRYYSERHGSDEERIKAIADDAIYYFTRFVFQLVICGLPVFRQSRRSNRRRTEYTHGARKRKNRRG